MTWALVTGASRGIGAATAVALADRGHDMIVHFARDADGAEKTAIACRERGVEVRVVRADLRATTDPLTSAMADVDGVAVLVNNAGITADGLAVSMGDEAFAQPWQVNVEAAFALCRAALRPMLRRRGGAIINVSSVVGLHGNVGQVNYAASKAAVIGMTKALAREVAKRGITVNAVAPGYIDTDMTAGLGQSGLVERIPAARLGTVHEVAGVISFLASPEASYVNGAVVQVDGGLFA